MTPFSLPHSRTAAWNQEVTRYGLVAQTQANLAANNPILIRMT